MNTSENLRRFPEFKQKKCGCSWTTRGALQKRLVTQNMRLRACRTPMKAKIKADHLNQFWRIDMTKIKLRNWVWMYLVVVLDWYSKKIVGYSFRFKSETRDWLEALNQAAMNQFPKGIEDAKERRRSSQTTAANPPPKRS